MTTRALDEVGDIVTSGTQFLTGDSAQEAAQNVTTRLKFFTNEWFLNMTDGTPWFDTNGIPGILGKSSRTLSSKESAIKQRILLAPSVAGMTSFSVDFELSERKLTVQAGIISKSGQTTEITIDQAAN